MNVAKEINGIIDPFRKGRAITTYTGIVFWPLDPRENEINIIDIAHSLSMQCRFNGHLEKFESVAEHSVRVAAECSDKNKLYGLLHDAAEAYVSDLPAPIKIGLPEFQIMEKNIMKVICKKYGLPEKEPDEVKKYDLIIRVTEMRDLRKDGISPGYGNIQPLKTKIEPWTSDVAKRIFLDVFNSLRKNAA